MAFKTRESLDTNLLVRLVTRDIPEQCLKVQDLLMRQGVTYEISDLAITEMVHVLQSNNLSREKIANGIEFIFSLPHIDANFALFADVLPMYLVHPKLSFNDCYLAAAAAMNEAEPLWTFDKALAKQSPTAKLLK